MSYVHNRLSSLTHTVQRRALSSSLLWLSLNGPTPTALKGREVGRLHQDPKRLLLLRAHLLCGRERDLPVRIIAEGIVGDDELRIPQINYHNLALKPVGESVHVHLTHEGVRLADLLEELVGATDPPRPDNTPPVVSRVQLLNLLMQREILFDLGVCKMSLLVASLLCC